MIIDMSDFTKPYTGVADLDDWEVIFLFTTLKKRLSELIDEKTTDYDKDPCGSAYVLVSGLLEERFPIHSLRYDARQVLENEEIEEYHTLAKMILGWADWENHPADDFDVLREIAGILKGSEEP